MQIECRGPDDISWSASAGWAIFLWALASGFSRTLTNPVEGLENRFVIGGIAIAGLLVASSLAALVWNVMKLRPALPIRRKTVLTIASVMVGLILLSEIRPVSAEWSTEPQSSPIKEIRQ